MTNENIIADNIEHFIAILCVNANPSVIPSNIAVTCRIMDSMQRDCRLIRFKERIALQIKNIFVFHHRFVLKLLNKFTQFYSCYLNYTIRAISDDMLVNTVPRLCKVCTFPMCIRKTGHLISDNHIFLSPNRIFNKIF